MCRMKSTARRSRMIASSSSSSEDDIFLGASQKEAHVPSTDAASFRAVSQRRDGVSS